jgi:protease-4
MKSFIKWVLILSTVLFIFLFAGIFILSALIDTQPKISSNSYLYVPVSGTLPDYIPPDPLENILGKTRLDMKKIRDTIEKAAVDDRINGIVLDIGLLQTGYAKINELHTVISKYRNSGKKIYAFIETGLMKEYYLALACDSIYMPPTGNLFLHGVNAEVTFYKGFFDKVGIEAEFTEIGKYKNAPEAYTRDTMSDEQQKILKNLVNQFYQSMINNISEFRNLSTDRVENLINNITGFNGSQAKSEGLIDQTGYLKDITKNLKIKIREPKKLHAGTYSIIPASSLEIRNESNIAVIHINGTIASGGDTDDPLFGNIAGANRVVNNLRNAASSRIIKAIILRIDSPGGSAIASEVMLHAIEEAGDKKPVIASIADYGASGGYLVALGADSIVALNNSLVGSIGVFAGKFNIQGLYEKLGLNSERISRGDNAGLFTITEPWSKQEKSIITKLISDYYDHFLDKVSSSRNLPMETVETLAQGRVWTGSEAQANGLVDHIGTIYDAIRIAQLKADIPIDESARLVYYPKERSVLEEFFSMVQASTEWNLLSRRKQSTFINQIQNKPITMLPFKILWN